MKQIKITEELLSTTIADLGVSVRITSILEKKVILTLQQLLYCCGRENRCDECSDSDGCVATMRLLDIDQFGVIALESVFEALEKKSKESRSV